MLKNNLFFRFIGVIYMMKAERITYGEMKPLELWMRFSLELGNFLMDERLKNKHNFNVYISIPNAITFSYFLMHGIFNRHMKEPISSKMLIDRFKSLEEGAIVYYLSNNQWKRCSVYEVIENYNGYGSYHIKIANHAGVDEFVPYKLWEERLIITNRVENHILRARRVEEVETFSGNITELYNSHQIHKYSILNTPSVYVMGNRAEFTRNFMALNLFYNKSRFGFEDILMDGTKGNFRNIRWVSSKGKNMSEEIKSGWLVMMGASKTLSKLSEYRDTNKIILENQLDNPESAQLVRDAIMTEIVTSKKSIITSELVERLQERRISIPNGVRLLAWK